MGPRQMTGASTSDEAPILPTHSSASQPSVSFDSPPTERTALIRPRRPSLSSANDDDDGIAPQDAEADAGSTYSQSPKPSRSTSAAASYLSLSNSDRSSDALPYRQQRRRQRQNGTGRLRSKLLCALITVLLAICVYGSFVEDFMGEVEAGISCGFCLGLLMPLQALAHLGDDAFVDLFVGFCAKLGIADRDVCTGAVGTQAPILAHDLRSISLASHAAKNFCGTIFGMCPLQAVIPYSINFAPQSEHTLVRAKRVSRGRKPFRVVHLSDVHVDRSYEEGANTVCTKTICCRDWTGLGGIGTGLNITKPAGKFGDKHCDSPPDLVQSMLRGIDLHVPDKEFTIFTGDVVESAVWLVNGPAVEDDLRQWHGEMQTPSYPAVGNHDIAPVNAFPRSTSSNANGAQWAFDLMAQDWEKWIGPEAAEQVATQSGCYAKVHPGTDLMIISLNTNYWYKQNFWLYDSDEPQWDPQGILSWLTSQLQQAEDAGQRAWIIGHMPFGKVDAMRDQSNYANQIFLRYADTIAAHFYGHSHVDEFEIAYSDYHGSNYHKRKQEDANGIAYIGGALTPASGNPVFRVYEVDPDTYEIMDFVPYFANRSEPSFAIEPEWKPYYSARESYGSYLDPPIDPLDPLDGKFWHRVTEKMEEDDSLFQLFNVRLSRGGKIDHCRGMCKNNTICSLRSLRSESNCAVIRPGFSFQDKERIDPEQPVTEPIKHENDPAPGEGEDGYVGEQSKTSLYDRQHDHFECEGPGLASMLREMVERGVGARDRKQAKKSKEGTGLMSLMSSMGAQEDAGDVNPLMLLKQEAERVVKEHRRKKNKSGGWFA